MNTFLFIFTAVVVLAGSALGLIAPIGRTRERNFRIIAACLTVTGGSVGIWMGLRSASKTEFLMGNTAKILERSGSTLKGVDETLQTSKSVLEETRKNLDTANKNLEITSRTLVSSKEASSYASGGESYPWVFPHDDGAGHIAFSLQKNGKYPLFSLRVFGGKATDILPTVVHYVSVGASREFPEFGGNVSYPLWFAPFPDEKSSYYSVTMFARNGSWEEVINIMRLDSGITWRMVLFGSGDSRITPYKKILDLADEHFPPSERNRKIYPLTEVSAAKP